jgi:hypothetical protein
MVWVEFVMMVAKISNTNLKPLYIYILICIYIFVFIYTSQQMKRYKGLMLNIFYIEKNFDKNRIYNLDSYGHI